MFCHNCGAALVLGDMFCENCGQKVKEESSIEVDESSGGELAPSLQEREVTPVYTAPVPPTPQFREIYPKPTSPIEDASGVNSWGEMPSSQNPFQQFSAEMNTVHRQEQRKTGGQRIAITVGVLLLVVAVGVALLLR
jgi:hypothetical protein